MTRNVGATGDKPIHVDAPTDVAEIVRVPNTVSEDMLIDKDSGRSAKISNADASIFCNFSRSKRLIIFM